MTYGDFKDLPKRIVSDKILHDKAFNIVKNPKYDGYRCGFASMTYQFLLKKLLVLILPVVLLKVKLYQIIS